MVHSNRRGIEHSDIDLLVAFDQFESTSQPEAHALFREACGSKYRKVGHLEFIGRIDPTKLADASASSIAVSTVTGSVTSVALNVAQTRGVSRTFGFRISAGPVLYHV